MDKFDSSRNAELGPFLKGQPSLSVKERIAMLVINCFAFFQTTLIICILISSNDWRHGLVFAALTLYLLPPFLALAVRKLFKLKEGTFEAGSRDFMIWWALFNLQVLFSRITVFEELLRIAPGLYSAWLRLWGAKIGRFTYWAPGTLILDRSFINIGNDVVFGAGVRLNPHVITVNETGKRELILATVTIGNRSIIGGYSLLTAGTEIADGECVRAFLISPPFSRWEMGKRTKASSQKTE